jgi:DNA mismatch repair ATPase MutL
VAGKWLLCHHHASWHAESEAAKQALRAASQPAKLKSKTAEKEEKEDEVGMDGILGVKNFGPLLGDENITPDKKPVKRIVLGSLSDILNGDLNDLLNDVDNELNDDESTESGMDTIELEDDDDDDSMLDDDDEGEEGSETEAVAIIKQWSQNASPSPSSRNRRKINVESAGAKQKNRLDCVAALRRLSNQGALSPRQKRVLVTDIISCSSKGKVSMVEVAYELLCNSEDDMDVADEEFADQCRVFASALEDELRYDE